MSRRSARPGNLPAEVTSFIGRTAELRAARKLLGDARLLTLTGGGGVGKTRLAIRLGYEFDRGAAGGVWLTDLASVPSEIDIAAAVSATLRDTPHEFVPAIATLGRILDEKRALLILDCCEHRLDACATFIAEILRATTNLRILTTTRQPLGMLGEHVLEIPPMAAPPTGPLSGGRLSDSDAVTLFVERASATVPSFDVSGGTAAAVAELCRRVGGLPLALELAAIRLGAMSLDDVLRLLEERHQLIHLSSRSPQPRQRSLQASHGWSHELCSAEERRLWPRLSVFAGRFDLGAAIAVCAGDGISPSETAEALAGLVEKSVVSRADDSTTVQYDLLPSVRQFGDLLSRDAGSNDKYRKEHARYFTEAANRLIDDMHSGGCAEIADTVRRNYENLAETADYLRAQGDLRPALRLATLLCLCPSSPHSRTPALRRLSAVLRAAPEPTPERAYGLWLHGLGVLAAGAQAEATTTLREAGMVADRVADTRIAPYLTAAAGLQAAARNDLESAFDLLARAFGEHAERADQFGLEQSYRHLLVIAWSRDDARWSARAEEMPGEWGLALEPRWAPYVCFASGLRHLRGLSVDEAAEELRIALADLRHCGDHQWIALCLEGIAQAAWLQKNDALAAHLLGFTGVLWDVLGISESFLTGLDPHGECAARLRSRLGGESYAAVAAAGARLSLDEAVDLALNLSADPATSVLTPRELSVAELVSRGLTNQAICEGLSISKRTTESHIEHIMTKLGFARRTQIATWFTALSSEDSVIRPAVAPPPSGQSARSPAR